MCDQPDLKVALKRLELACEFEQKCTAEKKFTTEQLNIVRAGLVFYFELTWKLCWEEIERWIKDYAKIENSLYQTAKNYGFISKAWPADCDSARFSVGLAFDVESNEKGYRITKQFISDAKEAICRLEYLRGMENSEVQNTPSIFHNFPL